MSKILKIGPEARGKVLAGVEKLASIVKVTLGPAGSNVILGQFIGAPNITKDGVSVARQVFLSDPIENLGCQLVKESAGRTAAVAGDGTTSATVLTHAIFKGGVSLINSGYSALDFRNAASWAKQVLHEELLKMVHPIETEQDLINIATISTNSDVELGTVIGQAYEAVNRTGLVVAEAVPNIKDSFRLVDGIELKSGYISEGFLEKNTTQRELNNALILICNWDITALGTDPDFLRAIQILVNTKKDVVLFCQNLKSEAFASLKLNFEQGTLKICPVKIPHFGKNQSKWLEDFATLTGATIIGGDYGTDLKDFDLKHCGQARKIIINSHQTKITEPKKNQKLVNEKIKLYKDGLNHLLGDLELKDLRDRIAFLTSKVAVISVGYKTELELREKGDRVEDAICAVRVALEEGYVAGGGFALWRAAQAVQQRLDEANVVWHPALYAILEACSAPAKAIIENSMATVDDIFTNLKENSDCDYGYNTATNQFGNMIAMGIIDPVKVSRSVLENALSIGVLLITTNGVVVDDPKDPSGWSPPAGYRTPENDKLNHRH